jgi:hypothetical protein
MLSRAITESQTRWQFYDPALLGLFPLTYVLHLAEEWFASAPIVHWMARANRPLDDAAFVIANGTGLVLMITGVWLATRAARFHWIVPALATAVLLNTTGHLFGSFSISSYSAGLVTAIILWIPLGMLTLLRAWDQARTRMLVAGVLAGVFIELVVVAMLPLVGTD